MAAFHKQTYHSQKIKNLELQTTKLLEALQRCLTKAEISMVVLCMKRGSRHIKYFSLPLHFCITLFYLYGKIIALLIIVKEDFKLTILICNHPGVS